MNAGRPGQARHARQAIPAKIRRPGQAAPGLPLASPYGPLRMLFAFWRLCLAHSFMLDALSYADRVIRISHRIILITCYALLRMRLRYFDHDMRVAPYTYGIFG